MIGIEVYIVIIICCILLSAFFAGTETGALSCSRIRIHHLAKSGDRRGRIAEKLLEAPERLITLILVGNNLVNVTATTVATYVLIQFVEEHHAELMSTLIMSAIILVFGEVLPKALFRQRADTLLPWAALVLRPFYVLLAPLVAVIAQLSKLLLRIVGIEDKDWRFSITRRELRMMVEESHRAGAMDPEHSRMIWETLDLRHSIIREIVTPLNRIPKVDQQSAVREILPIMAKTEQPGVLVVDASPSRVRGVVFPAYLLNVREETPVAEVMEPVVRIRDVERVDQVLEQLQNNWHHLALVIDRGGDVLGWVTLQDAVGKLVGEIEEERG
jgi:Mg2+/Co2+ transporter CorB